MIGCRVVKTSRSGTRLILIRLRLAMTAPSARADRTLMRSLPCGCAGPWPWRRPSADSSSVAAWPVRERKTSSRVGRRTPDVLDRDRAGVQPAQRLDQSASVPPETGTDSARVWASTLTSPSPTSASSTRTSSSRAASAITSSSRSPPIWVLSSSDVPSAMTWPWSTTTIRSASRSASSRYCVVSSRLVPAGHQLADHAPHVVAAARVQPGGRLVQEQHLRVGDQRTGQVEPAAHAAGVGLDRAVGRRRSRSNRSSSSRARVRDGARPRW